MLPVLAREVQPKTRKSRGKWLAAGGGAAARGKRPAAVASGCRVEPIAAARSVRHHAAPRAQRLFTISDPPQLGRVPPRHAFAARARAFGGAHADETRKKSKYWDPYQAAKSGGH